MTLEVQRMPIATNVGVRGSVASVSDVVPTMGDHVCPCVGHPQRFDAILREYRRCLQSHIMIRVGHG